MAAAAAPEATPATPSIIGIKFDQPGLGQKVGEDYKGFDVEVARYVAKELGFDRQGDLQGVPVGAAGDADSERPGRR